MYGTNQSGLALKMLTCSTRILEEIRTTPRLQDKLVSTVTTKEATGEYSSDASPSHKHFKTKMPRTATPLQTRQQQKCFFCRTSKVCHY
ncbi:hypothetical protein V6C07_10775 [Desulfovibrio sp. 1214_IL3152]